MRKLLTGLLVLITLGATAQLKENVVRVDTKTTPFLEKYYPKQLVRIADTTHLFALTHATLVGQSMKTVFDSGWYKLVDNGTPSLAYDATAAVKRSTWPYGLTPNTTTIPDLLDWFFYPSLEAIYLFMVPGAILGYSYYEVGSNNSVTISFTMTPRDDVPISGHADKIYPDSVSNVWTWTTATTSSHIVTYSPTTLDTVTYKAYETVRRGSDTIEVETAATQLRSCYPYIYGTTVNDYSSDWSGFYGDLGMTIDPKMECTTCYATYLTSAVLKYAYFAYPQSYGVLTSILDQNGFEQISAFTRYEESLTSSKWSSIPYYIYKSNTPFVVTSNWVYTFKQ